jgi:hypothetical protein
LCYQGPPQGGTWHWDTHTLINLKSSMPDENGDLSMKLINWCCGNSADHAVQSTLSLYFGFSVIRLIYIEFYESFNKCGTSWIKWSFKQ